MIGIKKYLLQHRKSADKSFITLFVLLSLFCMSGFSQIRTARIYKKGWEMSLPVIRYGSSDKIVLDFDLTGTEMKDYNYRILHCNANWEKSDILRYDYMEGFEDNPVLDVESSLNTLVDFYHYKITLPNSDVKLLISGNYKIQIFKEGDSENVVLEKRFYVTKDQVKINPRIKKAIKSESPDKMQAVNFRLSLLNYKVMDPYNDIRVDIMLNKNRNRMHKNIKPGYVDGDNLFYDNQNIFFYGGREYRHFQSRNYENYLESIKKVEFKAPYHIIYLEDIVVDPYGEYVYKEDINGSFKIDYRTISSGGGVDKDTDLRADYKKVVFNMPWNFPVTGGSVCITGRYNDWGCDTMSYNYEEKSYQRELLLKQGYYNYALVLEENGHFKYDYFDNSFYQTENDYYFFVYDVSPSGRYDKLISVFYTNSGK